MSSHPDADAFVRAILRDPAEVTTRLAFADWLEETGDPPNVAWAQFLRLSAAGDGLPPDGEEQRELKKQISELAPQIHTKLTIDATQLVGHAERFWQLLPKPNLIVRLAGYELSQPVIEFIPESVARENDVLPLALVGQRLWIATPDPANYDAIQKLQFILNKDIIPVRAEAEEVRAAIQYCYGQTETESVDSVSYEAPLIGLEGDLVSRECGGIFYTAFSRGCSGFEMEQAGTRCVLRYIPRADRVPDEHPTPEVFPRLLDHFLSLRPYAQYTERGTRCLDFDIPLLSGRRFPATLERCPAERGNRWFRVRFRWEDRG